MDLLFGEDVTEAYWPILLQRSDTSPLIKEMNCQCLMQKSRHTLGINVNLSFKNGVIYPSDLLTYIGAYWFQQIFIIYDEFIGGTIPMVGLWFLEKCVKRVANLSFMFGSKLATTLWEILIFDHKI